MRNRDTASGLFCVGLGIVFCIGAVGYGVGSPLKPGPGLYPLIIGIIFIVLALGLMGSSVKKGEVKKESIFPRGVTLRMSAVSLMGLVGYGVFVDTLGYLLTTFLFMVIQLRFVGSQKWVTVFTAAFLSTVLSYILFVSLLKSQFPTGILGI